MTATPKPRRGRIMREYWVLCGKCAASEALADIRGGKTPTSNAKQLGWKDTRAHGWLCPACQARKEE